VKIINSFQRCLLTGLCLAVLVAPAWTAQSQITARLQPQNLALGESAQLIVTINGSQAAQPNVPDVDGLEIVPIGEQTSMQIINGAISANVAQLFRVTPSRAGDFMIPPIAASGVGSTQPITLHVGKGAAGQAQRTAPHVRSQLPAASSAQPADAAPVDAKGLPAFLRVVLPKQELTVGELVPVKVKAYFRAGVSASLNGLPALSSDAFTLNKLDDKPDQTRESIDGVPYTVVTWNTALSAVKAGDYPLNLELPVMVRVQERAQRRGGGSNPFQDFFGDDSAFGDSFFDDFFGNATQKPLTLHTEGAVVKIKPLPAKGRPADFSGAVGQFEVTSEASAATGTTGDPLTLKMNVTGRGNFDRVSFNGVPASADWKSYKPNARFEPADASGTQGTKTFEQSIVPAKAGAQKIPALRFSYFDPATESYVTKTTAPIAVEIAQGNTTPPVVANTAPVADAPKANTDGLAADMAPTRATATLRPLVLAPWFIMLNALVFAALIIGTIFSFWRQRRANDPRRLQREVLEKSVHESLAAMDAALKVQDAPRFFTAARRALQERLAAQWQVPASRVTVSEIRSRLNRSGEGIRSVFQTADEIAYSGRRFTAPDLQQWRSVVQEQLHQIVRL
jgi:oxygen tolerance protein BatD